MPTNGGKPYMNEGHGPPCSSCTWGELLLGSCLFFFCGWQVMTVCKADLVGFRIGWIKPCSGPWPASEVREGRVWVRCLTAFCSNTWPFSAVWVASELKLQTVSQTRWVFFFQCLWKGSWPRLATPPSCSHHNQTVSRGLMLCVRLHDLTSAALAGPPPPIGWPLRRPRPRAWLLLLALPLELNKAHSGLDSHLHLKWFYFEERVKIKTARPAILAVCQIFHPGKCSLKVSWSRDVVSQV